MFQKMALLPSSGDEALKGLTDNTRSRVSLTENGTKFCFRNEVYFKKFYTTVLSNA
jgi:hypothetical protein